MLSHTLLALAACSISMRNLTTSRLFLVMTRHIECFNACLLAVSEAAILLQPSAWTDTRICERIQTALQCQTSA